MRRVPILMYHSISAGASERFRPWTVSPEMFADHMQLLADQGYRPITVSRFLDGMERHGAGVPARSVLVTFDDGFRDFHTTALPVLERHGFAATLYVVTAHLGGTARWLAKEREGERAMLTRQELHEVAQSGVECGAHSHRHPKLDELPAAEAREEITTSRRRLEDELQRPVRTFAYPHGYHGPDVKRLVREAGFDGAVAVRHAVSSLDDDRFALSRIIVSRDVSVADLARLLEGHGVPSAPFPERWRTQAWRVARRSRRTVLRAVAGTTP